ncbi:MAG: phospholipase D-like domain-containing protein [Akkermansiaceae bacterium]
MITLSALIAAAMSTSSCSPAVAVCKKQPIDRTAAVGTKKFEAAVARTTQSGWVNGNRITTLVNGKEFYPAMLKAIRGATKSITFETYAFVNGKTSREFVNAFCAKAKSGVKVHIILDGIGARNIGDVNVQLLRSAGVSVYFLREVSLLNPVLSNYRDHRKVMVVDGKIAFTGGCGIAEAWTGDAHTPQHWRETHYRVTGPVVAQIQHAFQDNWLKAGGKKLSGNNYFPKLSATGNTRASAFISAPIDKKFTIPHLYRQVISSARKSIVIQNSYVLLDRPLMEEILAARKRGVHVELIVPGTVTDAWMLRFLSRYQYNALLGAGVHIYEYKPTMLHCKVMVVDGVFSSVGSANFDPRSLYINDESNLNVHDETFAKEQLKIIARDKQKCQRILHAPALWNPLTMPSRAGAGLLFPQL